MAWAAVTGPMPRRSISPGARSLTMVCSWARLASSARPASRRARARRRISACRTACSRLASRGGAAPGQAGEDGVGERGRGRAWRSVSSPRSSSARSRLVCAVLVVVSSWRAPSRIRSASRSPSARGVGSRSASRRSAASTARWASIGSDLPLARGGSCGWVARTRATSRPAAVGGAGQPDAVAAGALDGDGQPRPGGVVDDPGQQLGVAGGVVADRGQAAIGAPLGRAISTWWVSRWVSTPTTASRSSASMGTGLVPSVGSGSNGRHRPG